MHFMIEASLTKMLTYVELSSNLRRCDRRFIYSFINVTRSIAQCTRLPSEKSNKIKFIIGKRRLFRGKGAGSDETDEGEGEEVSKPQLSLNVCSIKKGTSFDMSASRMLCT